MKGIRLSHGAVFVTDGVSTVALYPSGECSIARITYHTLEYSLASENPDTWEYLYEDDIRALPNGGYEKICAAFEKIKRRNLRD